MRRVRANLLIGPSVHPADLPRLRRAGVTAILSLQEPERDLPKVVIERMRSACEPGVAFRNVGIPDYDPEALTRMLLPALKALRELHADGRIVYVHCTEGINRAPSVALAYLVAAEALDVESALAVIRSADPLAMPYARFVEWLRAGGLAKRDA